MAKDLTDLLDKFYYHEALDRTHILCENINDHLLQHPVCKLDKEIAIKVELALDTLYEAYQIIGSRKIKNGE
jgi:hypothetical protein